MKKPALNVQEELKRTGEHGEALKKVIDARGMDALRSEKSYLSRALGNPLK
jgi:hypothetical protein